MSRPRTTPEDQLRTVKRFVYLSQDEEQRVLDAMQTMGQTSFSEFLRLAALERARLVRVHIVLGPTVSRQPCWKCPVKPGVEATTMVQTDSGPRPMCDQHAGQHTGHLEDAL